MVHKRKELGLSAKEMALQKYGISEVLLKMIENGAVTHPEIAKKILQAVKLINSNGEINDDLTIDANGIASGDQLYVLATSGQPADQVKYISATAVHHNDETYADNDGSNTFHVTAHITKISDATESNSGLADAYDVKNAIDNIFGWVDLSEWASNNPLNRTDARP